MKNEVLKICIGLSRDVEDLLSIDQLTRNGRGKITEKESLIHFEPLSAGVDVARVRLGSLEDTAARLKRSWIDSSRGLTERGVSGCCLKRLLSHY